MARQLGNVLWGKRGDGLRSRIIVIAAVVAVALLAPAVGRAATVSSQLLAKAQTNPGQTFDVIIQTGGGSTSPSTAVVNASPRSSGRRSTTRSGRRATWGSGGRPREEGC